MRFPAVLSVIDNDLHYGITGSAFALRTSFACRFGFAFALDAGFFVTFPSLDFRQDSRLLNFLLETLQSGLDTFSLSNSYLRQ